MPCRWEWALLSSAHGNEVVKEISCLESILFDSNCMNEQKGVKNVGLATSSKEECMES